MNGKIKRQIEGYVALESIRRFIGESQRQAVRELIEGEEGEFFIAKMIELAERIAGMPKTYEQDGKGSEAVAYLHYFTGPFDCWITEKDVIEDRQLQAFGLVRYAGSEPELGYINLEEILENGAELDFHFTPTTLFNIKKNQ